MKSKLRFSGASQVPKVGKLAGNTRRAAVVNSLSYIYVSHDDQLESGLGLMMIIVAPF